MKKPLFRLIAVITLDGKIARNSSHLSDWSSKEDKKFFHRELDTADVVLVGNNTYKTAKKFLLKRNLIVFTRHVTAPRWKSEKCVFMNLARTNIQNYCQAHGYRNVAVLGGTQIFDYFLGKNLAHELLLTLEPIVFGKGISLFEKGKKNTHFRLVSLKKLNKGGTLLLRYGKR
ncbi:MAG TPA: dihydrofolate reductase family protein [archaeon]|nr:dihydrofolate reductase family protein [archaeon]